MGLEIIYLINIYWKVLALNNFNGWYDIKSNQTKLTNVMVLIIT